MTNKKIVNIFFFFLDFLLNRIESRDRLKPYPVFQDTQCDALKKCKHRSKRREWEVTSSPFNGSWVNAFFPRTNVALFKSISAIVCEEASGRHSIRTGERYTREGGMELYRRLSGPNDVSKRSPASGWPLYIDVFRE